MVTGKEHEDAERRIQAELQVEAFMQLLASRYNLKSEDIPELVDDMRWLRKQRTGLVRIQWSVALGLVALAASGVWQALMTGLKAMVTK